MTNHVFKMANTLEAVDPMVLSLKAVVEGVLAKDGVMRFEICAIEALTNTVEHAPTTYKDKPIDIVLKQVDGEITLDIFDPEGAPPFDLNDHATDLSTIDPMAEGGRGLGLILQCADHVEYGDCSGRNRLSLGFNNAQ